jgi:low temperature requirement protein LtrA
MNTNRELLKKITLTQRCALVALIFLGGIVVSQLVGKQQLAEKFAVVLYYNLCIATFLALTEHHHQKISQYITKFINKIDEITEQKQYRWAYLCYFIFVVVIIRKY